MGRILPRSFYARETEIVARELLGQLLVHRTSEGTCSGIITETEAYLGEHDAACHAAAGLTARTRVLYEAPGTAYVYFVYGMHWCVNAVTREIGLPSAVLIRALQPTSGVELMRRRRARRGTQSRRRTLPDKALADGPGKLCQALGIDGGSNGASLLRGSLVIRAGEQLPDSIVQVTPRIGIRKAAEWPLRYVVGNCDGVMGSGGTATA